MTRKPLPDETRCSLFPIHAPRPGSGDEPASAAGGSKMAEIAGLLDRGARREEINELLDAGRPPFHVKLPRRRPVPDATLQVAIGAICFLLGVILGTAGGLALAAALLLPR